MCASVCFSSARACAGKMTDAASIACMPLTMPAEARGLHVPEFHLYIIICYGIPAMGCAIFSARDPASVYDTVERGHDFIMYRIR